MLELFDGWYLKGFKINEKNLQYHTYPDYLPKSSITDSESFVISNDAHKNALRYYNNFFQAQMFPQQCRVELHGSNQDEKYYYKFNAISVTSEELDSVIFKDPILNQSFAPYHKNSITQCSIKNGESIDPLDNYFILNQIYLIKKSQINCQIQHLNNKLNKNDSSIIDDLIYNTQDVFTDPYPASDFDSLLIKPIIERGTEKALLPYALIYKHKQDHNFEQLLHIPLKNITESVCDDNYTLFINKILPTMTAGISPTELQQLKEIFTSVLTHTLPIINLTAKTAVANIISCKYSLSAPCKDLTIYLYNNTIEHFSDNQSGQLDSTEGSTSIDKIVTNFSLETLAHELSHFIDGLFGNKNLPYPVGDKVVKETFNKILENSLWGDIYNSSAYNRPENIYTEFVAWSISNTLYRYDNNTNLIVGKTSNAMYIDTELYKGLNEWRINHILIEALNNATHILCESTHKKDNALSKKNEAPIPKDNFLICAKNYFSDLPINDLCNPGSHYGCYNKKIVVPLVNRCGTNNFEIAQSLFEISNLIMSICLDNNTTMDEFCLI